LGNVKIGSTFGKQDGPGESYGYEIQSHLSPQGLKIIGYITVDAEFHEIRLEPPV
jgi:hypothetical protein